MSQLYDFIGEVRDKTLAGLEAGKRTTDYGRDMASKLAQLERQSLASTDAWRARVKDAIAKITAVADVRDEAAVSANWAS